MPGEKAAPACPECGTALISTRRRGQSIVEFALVLPLLIFLLLGFGEAAFLVATREGYQNGVKVLAEWAASEMYEQPGESWQSGWGRVVNDEQGRTGCGGVPTVSFPDGGHDPGDRVRVRWSCTYHPRITSNIWQGLPVTVESEAVVPGFLPVPTPSPS